MEPCQYKDESLTSIVIPIKGKMVSQLSYVYNGNSSMWKDSLYLETDSMFLCPPVHFPTSHAEISLYFSIKQHFFAVYEIYDIFPIFMGFCNTYTPHCGLGTSTSAH